MIRFSNWPKRSRNTTIGVHGKVRPQEKVPNGAEIVPIEIRLFSIAKKAAPFLVQGRTSTVGIDTQLDLRAVDLRHNYLDRYFAYVRPCSIPSGHSSRSRNSLK